jgi:predicted DNA-binding transcriptional regulator AlpA
MKLSSDSKLTATSASRHLDLRLAELAERTLPATANLIPAHRQLWDVHQVATRVQYTTRTIWRLVRAKKFPAPIRTSSRHSRWFAEDVEKWLAQFEQARQQ